MGAIYKQDIIFLQLFKKTQRNIVLEANQESTLKGVGVFKTNYEEQLELLGIDAERHLKFLAELSRYKEELLNISSNFSKKHKGIFCNFSSISSSNPSTPLCTNSIGYGSIVEKCTFPFALHAYRKSGHKRNCGMSNMCCIRY